MFFWLSVQANQRCDSVFARLLPYRTCAHAAANNHHVPYLRQPNQQPTQSTTRRLTCDNSLPTSSSTSSAGSLGTTGQYISGELP